ncbi:STM4011 family radical SAM protein, partial [Deinococcus pimensis]|uniref:STM4011 family radical SAM protein n=1 Tax=Deinococcus pimensis TaxID=309888 RepID=UPI00146FAA67
MALADARHLRLLYRGDLSSCNYGCRYCPFAKRTMSREEHARDASQLSRFVTWVETRDFDVSVLFTPWGEALARRRYQDALVRLSHARHVRRVAVQTNLSGRLDWLARADRSRVALWATYHPTQTTRALFLARCRTLSEAGVRYSVGMVGVRSAIDEVEALRAELPPGVYLWVNALQGGAGYYAEEDVRRLSRVDPLFELNTRRYRTRGVACAAGETVVSVDGDGTVRRCHFIERPIGNLYDEDFLRVLVPRPCSRATCSCHIGYAHVEALGVGEAFGEGVLERVAPPELLTDRAALGALLERAAA